jgi:hypothetical protein
METGMDVVDAPMVVTLLTKLLAAVHPVTINAAVMSTAPMAAPIPLAIPVLLACIGFLLESQKTEVTKGPDGPARNDFPTGSGAARRHTPKRLI